MADPTRDRDPFPVTTVLTLVPVRAMAAATAFYRSWFGREADVVVDPGMAEWELAPGAWLQVAEKAGTAGTAVVRIGVDDVAAARKVLLDRGVEVDDPVDYGGFVRVADFRDPDGNRFSLVEDLT